MTNSGKISPTTGIIGWSVSVVEGRGNRRKRGADVAMRKGSEQGEKRIGRVNDTRCEIFTG